MQMANAKPADAQNGETISKSEAVRRALAEGWTKPTEGILFIKTMFGIDMSPSHFSNIKTTEVGGKKKPGRPKGSQNKPKTEPMLAATVVELREERPARTIAIEDIQSVKELVNKLGADAMKLLVGLLSK